MNTLYTRNEATEIFGNFANAHGLKFYTDFDIDFLKYKGLFENPNDNGDITVKFSVYENELTEEFLSNVMDSVINTFNK